MKTKKKTTKSKPKPKKGKGPSTYLSLLLDRSGSMASIREATIDAFNEFVGAQVKLPGTTAWTLTIFDSEGVDRLYHELPGAQVPTLSRETFVPRSLTPLLDSIAKVAKDALDLGGKYDRHVLVIQTDGYENASREFTFPQVSALLKDLEAKGWQILYLGAGIDAIKSMKDAFGTVNAGAVNYFANEASTLRAGVAMSTMVASYRTTGQTTSLNACIDAKGNLVGSSTVAKTPRRDPMAQLRR